MCGRYVLGALDWEEYREMLSILLPDETTEAPRFNVHPTDIMPIVLAENGEVHQVQARWGLIPPWFRDDPKAFRGTTFNARIETAHEKPSFRPSWRAGRCLVPATGWYEWSGAKGARQPWFITLERNAAVFWFAGLHARRADGLRSYTILTRAADPVIANLHPRMPVLLQDSELSDWLATADAGPAPDALGTGFGPRLGFHKVAPVRGDDESLLEPLDENEAPVLEQGNLF